MSNSIKYSISPESDSLKKGNFWTGTNDVPKGPTQATGFYSGIVPPAGGYTVYLNKASGGPSAYCPSNDSDLISLTNRIAQTSYTTVAECFSYYQGQNDKMIINRDYESILTNGLIFNFDAGYLPSYPRTGLIWYDVSPTGLTGSILNGTSYNSGGEGSFFFDETDDRVYIGPNTSFALSQFTVSVWCYPTNAANASGATRVLISYTDSVNWRSGWSISTYPYLAQGPQINFFINTGTSTVSVGSLISNNQWYNFTMTFDGSNIIGYVNGANRGQAASTVGYRSSNVLQIGDGFGFNSPFKGLIASTFVYNRALSETEVVRNFNAQKSRFGI